MTKEFCTSVITIPQISGTCWFNALIMMIFYSQNSRKLLLHYKPFKNKTDKLSKTLKSILYKNYKLDKKTIDFFTKNNIDSILSNFDLDIQLKKFIFKYGYFIPYFLNIFFKAIEIEYLTIDFFNTYSYSNFGNLIKNYYFSITETISIYEDYYNNHLYETFLNDYNLRQEYKKYIKNKIENYVPLYLVINLWDSYTILNNYFGNNLIEVLNDFNILNNYYKFSIIGIYELLNEITFNGRTYILDSISLGNYNDQDIKLAHAIAGITCKNNKFVYNGWIRNTNDPAMKTGINRTLPCELMPYDWDINKDNDFCINKNACDLKGAINKYSDLCFSFYKGNRTLIYILKDDDYKSLDINKSYSSSFSYKEHRKTSERKRKEFEELKEKEEIRKKSENRRKELKEKEELKKKEDRKKRSEINKKRRKEIKEIIKKLKKNLNLYIEYKNKISQMIINNNKKIKNLILEYKKYE